jgi:hypothetical protein
MSDFERGDARAQGAFANWIMGLRNELAARDRSPEYVKQFWETLSAEMANFSGEKTN